MNWTRAMFASQTDSIDRFTLLIPWVSIFVPTALWAAGFQVPSGYHWGPLLASVILFGLPHGAIDHLAIPRIRRQPPSAKWLVMIGLLYLILGGAYGLLWFISPKIAITAFIILTWVHWGQGDLYPLRAVLATDHLETCVGRGLAVTVRGGLPMLVPLLSHPERYRAVVGRVLELFDISLGGLEWVFIPRTRLVLGILFVSLTALTIGRGYMQSETHKEAWAIDTGEVALLWWCFWVVPPLVAVGIYFAMWHSVRHVGRLMSIDTRSGGLSASLRAFARDASPLSAISLVLLGGLAMMVPWTVATVPDLVALYLVLLAVLTLPHIVIVTWMDREQSI